MDLSSVLKWIEESDDAESQIAMKALVRRREMILEGGEVVYAEYSREQVEKLEKRLNQIMADYREMKID